MQPLLEVKQLRTSFFTEEGELRAVDGVSFAVEPGKLMGLVGESGSGKTVTALSIMRLLPESARMIGRLDNVRGRRTCCKLAEPQMRARSRREDRDDLPGADDLAQSGVHDRQPDRRGDPAASAAPSRNETRERTVEALHLVGIADPERRIDDYPHQLSGGMRQRVMIAMALACKPRLLIADEPTTALDVTIQAQILDLIRDLQQRLGLAVILVTHDLGIVAEYADDVTILYAARVMEQASRAELFRNPLNPYTRCLLQSIPGVGRASIAAPCRRSPAPSRSRAIRRADAGFIHAARWRSIDCARVDPPLEEKAPSHYAACIRV